MKQPVLDADASADAESNLGPEGVEALRARVTST